VVVGLVARLLGVALVPSRVDAQSQARGSTEIFGGYSYLRDPGNSVIAATTSDDGFGLGWAGGIAQPVWRAIAAVGEVSGHYKTRTTLDNDVTLTFYAFMAGPRASAAIGRVSEFAQALVGAVHGTGSAFGTTVSTTAFAIQPGGGIDYPIGSRFAARLELDYRWIKGTDGGAADDQFRLVAAFVFHP
jgi:hypothetical protein